MIIFFKILQCFIVTVTIWVHGISVILVVLNMGVFSQPSYLTCFESKKISDYTPISDHLIRFGKVTKNLYSLSYLCNNNTHVELKHNLRYFLNVHCHSNQLLAKHRVDTVLLTLVVFFEESSTGHLSCSAYPFCFLVESSTGHVSSLLPSTNCTDLPCHCCKHKRSP